MQSNFNTKLKHQTGYLTLAIYFALALSTMLVYWQVRNFDFVNYDDDLYVFQNQQVLKGLTFDGLKSAFTTAPACGNWLPLTWLSFMLDCQFFGPDPGWIHLVNVFLHLANTLLLFTILKKMTGSLWPSAFVAAVFALHPLHIESVAWVTERKDVLSTFFMLLTLAAYIGYTKSPSVYRYLLSLVLFAMGLMAKPMLVTLPFVLLLLDYWPLERMKFETGDIAPDNKKTGLPWPKLILEKIPFLALSITSSVITFFATRAGGSSLDVIGLKFRVFNAAVAYCEYIKKMFWPSKLAVFYPHPGNSISPAKAAACIILLLGLTALFVYLARRRKYLATGWLWYLGTLVPVIGIVQVGGQSMADRYTYIPFIGLFIIIAWSLQELLSKWRYRQAILGVSMAIVLTGFGICSYQQLSVWKNSVSLFSQALEVTQNNSLAYNNLGNAYSSLGSYQEAIEAFKQAIRIKPDTNKTFYNLGNAYSSLGRYQEAIKAYKQAIRIKPDYADAYNNLGNAYCRIGRYQEAIEPFKQAISFKPDYAKAYNGLGAAYGSLGRFQEAAEAFKQAINLKPDDHNAYNNLGIAYRMLGRYEEAIEVYKQVIKLNPDIPYAHYNLGNAYLNIGDKESALKEYKILKTLNAVLANKLYNIIKK
jgi:tetratricopeptide (TPR) repeat protein